MIHPTALVNEPPYYLEYRWSDPGTWKGVEIHDDALIEAYVVVCVGVERPTKIEAGAWLISQVHVGHDVWIKEGAVICPMSSLGGFSVIGRNARLDQGVTVHPYREIGDGARVGMGSVVIRDVPAWECWAGNPARKLYDLCRTCRRRDYPGHDCEPR